jgi:hypothetical protein
MQCILTAVHFTSKNPFHGNPPDSSPLRLLSKSLFPYNIGPVYRLLERVQAQHNQVMQFS